MRRDKSEVQAESRQGCGQKQGSQSRHLHGEKSQSLQNDQQAPRAQSNGGEITNPSNDPYSTTNHRLFYPKNQKTFNTKF